MAKKQKYQEPEKYIPKSRREEIERANMEKRERAKRKQREKILVAVIAALILGICVVVICLFEVDDMSITCSDGTSSAEWVYNSQDIINASGVSVGQKLLFAYLFADEDNITETLPYIEEVEITIEFPGTVIITFSEAEAAFAHENDNGTYVLLSRSLKVLDTDATDTDNATLVLGLSFTKTQEGETAEFEDDSIAEDIIEIREYCDEYDISKITKINIESIYDITIVYKNLVTIELGSMSNMAEKIRMAAATIEDRDDEGLSLSVVIDVSDYTTAYVREDSGESETEAESEEESSTEATSEE